MCFYIVKVFVILSYLVTSFYAFLGFLKIYDDIDYVSSIAYLYPTDSHCNHYNHPFPVNHLSWPWISNIRGKVWPTPNCTTRCLRHCSQMDSQRHMMRRILSLWRYHRFWSAQAANRLEIWYPPVAEEKRQIISCNYNYILVFKKALYLPCCRKTDHTWDRLYPPCLKTLVHSHRYSFHCSPSLKWGTLIARNY